MQKTKINIKAILAISLVLLLLTNTLTYTVLLSKYNEWKTSVRKSDGLDASAVAEALANHVYYDGDSIPCDQLVKHYNCSGKLLGSGSLNEVLRGDKVVMLLSTNNCMSCTKHEIMKILKLAQSIGRERLVVVADFALHTQPSWAMLFGDEGYYETDVEHLGLSGTPTRETPVVMLTKEEHVVTSYVVGPWTTKFSDDFHRFLANYFKEKK
jgi:hypothetical protein